MTMPAVRLTDIPLRFWSLVVCTAGCIAFGLALIANVHLPAEGSWHFIARSWLEGKRLYADLYLVQQPLYILLTAGFQAVFGTLIAFALLCGRLMAWLRLPWPLDCCGLMMLFFLGIRFVAFRFDDYHAVMHCLIVASLIVSLSVPNGGDAMLRRRVLLLAGLNSLGITLRLNDGAMMAAVNTVVLWGVLPRARRLRLLSEYSLAMIAGVLTIVTITGDSFMAWAIASIGRGAATKGGGALTMAPLMFVRRCVTGLLTLESVGTFQFLLDAGGVAAFAAAMIAVCAGFSRRVDILVRTPGIPSGVFLLPAALCISASVSGGGYHHGHFFASALISLLGVAWVVARWPMQTVTTAASVACGAIALASAVYRWQDPCSWHDYRSKPLFRDRIVVTTPTLGPCVISRSQQDFNDSLFGPIGATANVSLLSIPFPYPNYLLGIPPWHDYIQTFFDTTDRSRIEKMIRELSADPPDWIVYQRQPDNLAGHEQLFNAGRPLPHRALDAFIDQQLLSGAWQPVVWGRESGRNSSTWYVIRTRASKQGLP